LGLRETGLQLLSVGHLVELKGHHLAIEMLCSLPEAHLAVVGSGPERGALESLAQRLGVQERVRFAGQQPADALKTWFSAADALVLASSREGWANVLLESMACGTPVVATAVNGTPEVVARGGGRTIGAAARRAAPAAGLAAPAGRLPGTRRRAPLCRAFLLAGNDRRAMPSL
jgi:teichuronic acid biosynthesis glycosyltransferase TuaC